jgi:hypothetical protein
VFHEFELKAMVLESISEKISTYVLERLVEFLRRIGLHVGKDVRVGVQGKRD